jgi:hypothetical protein
MKHPEDNNRGIFIEASFHESKYKEPMNKKESLEKAENVGICLTIFTQILKIYKSVL